MWESDNVKWLFQLNTGGQKLVKCQTRRSWVGIKPVSSCLDLPVIVMILTFNFWSSTGDILHWMSRPPGWFKIGKSAPAKMAHTPPPFTESDHTQLNPTYWLIIFEASAFMWMCWDCKTRGTRSNVSEWVWWHMSCMNEKPKQWFHLQQYITDAIVTTASAVEEDETVNHLGVWGGGWLFLKLNLQLILQMIIHVCIFLLESMEFITTQ